MNSTNGSSSSNSSSNVTNWWVEFIDTFTPEAQSLLTFDGFMNFSIGILNGTQAFNISNFQVCRDVINDMWLDETVDAFYSFTNFSFFDGFYDIWDIMYSSDTVAHSCYAGMEELILQAYNETETLDSNGTLSGFNFTAEYQSITNVAYNFGTIYDNLEALYFFIYQTPYSTGITPSQAGNLLGQIIYLSHKNPVPVNSTVAPALHMSQSVLKVVGSVLKAAYLM